MSTRESRLPEAILVAVDFTNRSAQAITLAGLIADRCDVATLRLLHAEAVDVPPYFTFDQIEALQRQQQATRLQAEQYLSSFGRQHTRRPFSSVVEDRSPVDAVLYEAINADLLVIGAHGRHGPGRWWLGSVAERVLRDVGCPLLFVRGTLKEPLESAFSRVLVHAAAPLVGAAALAFARSLTACFSGQVFDGRSDVLETVIEKTDPTLLVAPAPQPRSTAWLFNYGEPLFRSSNVPILFVPE